MKKKMRRNVCPLQRPSGSYHGNEQCSQVGKYCLMNHVPFF